MSIKKLYDFLVKPIDFQIQSMFEFRYPVLFDDDSFLIEQLNFPQLEANTGNVYLDGYQIPVHSTGKFGNNEITFTMYVEEKDFYISPSPGGSKSPGKYFKIFNALLSNDHKIIDSLTGTYNSAPAAKIIPLSAKRVEEDAYLNMNVNNKTMVLYNALIKSISLSGGFSANATTLSKFDVTMTFSYMEHFLDRFEF